MKLFPKDHFTSFGVQNRFWITKIQWSPDLEALNLWKGRSGCYALENLNAEFLHLFHNFDDKNLTIAFVNTL